MRRMTLLAALALAACRPEPVEEFSTVSVPLLADEAVGFAVMGASGNLPLSTYGRTVNEFGAAVYAGSEEVVVDGSTVAVTMDGLGYGEIVIEQGGSFEVLGGDEPAWVHAFDSTWAGFGMQEGAKPLGEGVFAQPVSGGVAVASATEVWWVGRDLPPHRVLTFPEGRLITGIRSGNADSDGRLDLLVWGGDTAIILRGRPGGGMAWASAFRAEGNAVVGGSFGDVNEDDVQDVVLAWAVANGTSMLDILEGDGIGNYVGASVSLSDVPSDVGVGDNNGDGSEEITVVAGVNWQRFGWSPNDQSYVVVGPSNLAGLNFPAGTKVWPGRDYNGDGADEIVMVGPLQNGQDREVLVYDLVGQANVTFLSLSPFGAEVALGDSTGDGQGEVFMLEETGELKHVVWYNNDGSRLNTADVGERGPIALSGGAPAADLDDLFVAGDTWTWWHGTAFEGEGGEVWWTEGEPEVAGFATGQTAFARVETDGDIRTVEIAGVGRNGGGTAMQIYQVAPGSPPQLATLGAPVTLATTARQVEDVAACGSVVYALLDGELHRIAGGSTTSVAATGTAVACGVGPSGSVAATLAGDTVSLWTDTLASAGTQTESGAENLALGDSTADLQVCTSPGCGVVFWPYGTGTGEWAVSTRDGIEVGGVTLHGGGELSVADVDGNGLPDLLASWEGGRLAVYRSTGDGFGQGEFFHMSRELLGPPIVADGADDGDLDLVVTDTGGGLYITPTPGTPPAVNGARR